MKQQIKNAGCLRRKMILLILLQGLSILVTISGCSSYGNNKKPGSIHPLYIESPSGKGNPLLVFDHPTTPRNLGSTNSETIMRWDWPVAQSSSGYVTTRETMAYEERTDSDQYISSDNSPRQNYHRRVTTYRFGTMYR